MTGFESRANNQRPGGPLVESLIIDARYACRRLLSRPTYATLAVLTIALGAGGSAAVFSVVKTLLMEPLPFEREEEVGVLWFQQAWSEEEFLGLRPDFPGFLEMAAYRPNSVTLDAPGGPLLRVSGSATSSELFDVLGVDPMLGRTFQPGEDLVGAARVVVLSHPLWQELGADLAIIGTPLNLGGQTHTVIGVMPPGFWFPNPDSRVWTAAQMTPENGGGFYSLVGRVAEGRSIEQMAGPLRAFTETLGENFDYPIPQWDKTQDASITPIREVLVGDVRPSLLAALGATGLILLIGCANVTSLIIGQVDARTTEIEVRRALGANRWRLVQHLTIEICLMGLLAGGIGALLAAVGFETLLQSLPLGSLAESVRLDWTVFQTSMLVSMATAVLASLIPGLSLWRNGDLRLASSMTRVRSGLRRGGRFEGVLVVGQIALAVVVVVAAGLLIRSVANLRSLDPGVAVDGVAVIDTTLPAGLTGEQRQREIETMLPLLDALPGVNSVAAAQKLPLRGSGYNVTIRIEGRPEINATTAFRPVTTDYFTTMGVPMSHGRDFGPGDRPGNERVVIVNEALADAFFPGEDPIGQRLYTFDAAGERIVGVVGNVLENGLTDGPVPARYMLIEQVPPLLPEVSFILRSDVDRTGGVLTAARSAIGDSGRFAVERTTTMQNIFDRAMGPTRQLVVLLSLLGSIALILSAVGIYGVMWHFAQRRLHDYGIRIALGQLPSGVLLRVLSHGTLLVLLGSLMGVGVALAGARLLSSLLYGVEPTDRLSLSVAVLVLLLIGVAATWVPARRASLADPATLLRES